MEPIRGHCQWMMWGSTGSVALLLDQTTRWWKLIKDAFSCTHRIIDCKRLWFLTTADEIIDIIPVKSWGFSGAFLQQHGSYYSNCVLHNFPLIIMAISNLVVNICLFEKFQVLANTFGFFTVPDLSLKKTENTAHDFTHDTQTICSWEWGVKSRKCALDADSQGQRSMGARGVKVSGRREGDGHTGRMEKIKE